MASHSGAGTRHRTHHHYLKGLLWCDRCKRRFIVQRAKGRSGGIYYYFFCIGRQDGSCDHPYVPVEVMEQAVIDHYGTAVHLPAAFRQEVRAQVDAAIAESGELSSELRERYQNRLEALERKEDYYLDLAGEEGWPKDKLRNKIQAIRAERARITASLERAERQLDTGKQVFTNALDLLDHPQVMYERGNEQVRTILNRAFFARLYVDGRKVTGQELREPFNVLVGAYDVLYRHGEVLPQGPAYYRRGGAPGSAQSQRRITSLGIRCIASRPYGGLRE